MARAAAGIGGKPVIVAICNSLSPLAWDERMLEGIRVFAERNQPINISCCSMSGATAPVQLAGSIVQANAEVLGGLLYAQLVAPGTPVIYGTTSSVMDMGAMGLALGAPEYTLISAGCAQMAARYKLPYRGGGGLTDAKILDGQAMSESAWNLVYSLSEGVHFMLQSVGVLESFMSASFDKWVADEEVILRHQRLARGLGPWPEDLMETLSQGLAAGGYLKLKSTLKKFRTEFYRPRLGDRRSFEIWKSAGRDYRAEAWALVRKRLESYAPPPLAPEAKEAMRAVLAKAGVEPDYDVEAS
jgi:trimethylamine--corrinoid protein Co-methyltransferase